MLGNFKFILVQFYNGEEHMCQLFKNINDIAKELSVHRTTIYNNYDNDNKYYKIIKNKTEYYIKSIN